MKLNFPHYYLTQDDAKNAVKIALNEPENKEAKIVLFSVTNPELPKAKFAIAEVSEFVSYIPYCKHIYGIAYNIGYRSIKVITDYKKFKPFLAGKITFEQMLVTNKPETMETKIANLVNKFKKS